MVTEKQHEHNKSEENVKMLKRLAEARKGKSFSEEHKAKLRSKTPWNKNLHGKKYLNHFKTGETCPGSLNLKGKTWEEIYGKEEAQRLKEKRKEHFDYLRQSATINLKGKGFRVIRLWETDINQLNLEDFAEICYGIQ